MTSVRQYISWLVVLITILFSQGKAQAAEWYIYNYNDFLTIDDSSYSLVTGFPYGVTDWGIRNGTSPGQVYHPMFKESFWYRIGSLDKQTSFSKLPATGVYNADSSAATLTFTDTQVPARFKAIVTYQVTGKPTFSYKSSTKKSVTIQNLTGSVLDYHLFSYSDLDISTSAEGFTDNAVIVNGERAIQTGFDAVSGAPVGRTLIQTSSLKPSRYSTETLGSALGSILDSLENAVEPFDIVTYDNSLENTDMQFAFQYDLKIPANGSISFDIANQMVETKPLNISTELAGASCAGYTENVTYNICFDNLSNTLAANNVVVSTSFTPDYYDPSGTFPFLSATDNGVYDAATKTIGWTFPSMAAGAQKCVQATVGVNTAKAFTAEASIHSDETFPARVSVATPLCNYPPIVNSTQPANAYTGVEYVYQVTARDTESEPLTFTLVQAPAGMVMSGTGRITWTPTSAQGNLSFPVGVDISDGNLVTHYTFSVYARWQNQSPSAPAQQAVNAVVNQPLSYQTQAIDPDSGQALTYTTASILPAGLTLSSSGLLSGTPTAIGTYTINVTVADPSQKTISTALLVNITAVATPQTPNISWTAPSAITYGTPLSATQLNATVSGIPGNLAYTPVSGTALNAGSQTLSVTFTPNDTSAYNIATKTVSLTVNKAVATVTLGGLSQTYNGSAKSATATTNPAGLSTSFTYAGSATAPTAAGSYAVVGTISNANYTGSANGTLVIAKATPSITWAAPSAIITGTSLSATQLNATASAAGSFVYTPASGTVMNTVGTQALSASFTPTDSVNYNSASASVNLTVNGKQTPVITWATPAAITYDTALSGTQLNATVGGGIAGSFAYNPAIGTVLNAGSQTLSVTFTPTDTSAYNSATKTVSLTVNKAVATVTLGGLSQTYNGSAKSATATTNPAGLSTGFTYAGSATAPTAAGSYAVVGTISNANYTGSANGTLVIAKATPSITWAAPSAIITGTSLSATQLNATASAAGSFVYTPASGTVMNTVGTQALSASFTPTDSANYNGATKSVNLTVNGKQTPVITWATPAAITYDTALSGTQLNATVGGGIAGSFAYTPAIGTVLIAGSQTLSVTFTPTDTSAYNSATKTVSLMVNKAVATVTLGGLSQTYSGSPKSATATTNPAGLSTGFTYAGSATAPTAAGSYAVVGTISNANYTGSANGTLVIAKATPSITWAAPSAIITGTSLSATQLNATASTAGSFVYTPASGTAMNTAGTQALSTSFTPTDSANYNSATATVNLTVNSKQTPVITWATPAAITYGTALSSTQLNATVGGGIAGSFAYTPAIGSVPNAGSQTLSVTFTPNDTSAYNSATKTVSLTVNKAAATVTLSGLSQTYNGSAKSATATTNPAGLTLSYTYDGSATAPTNAGSYEVVATVSSANYSGSATAIMIIAKATPTIDWTAPAAINLGTTLSVTQLDATASIPGSFVYTPASGTLMNTTGAQTLSASFTPVDTTNFNKATAAVSITVNGKQTPSITWGTPAAITYGTALSATQLNATVVGGIPGSFVYTPASGTVLAAGSQTLSVTFTPNDTNAYNSATKTVSLTVNKAAATVTLGGLSQTYNGSAKSATATTNPAGLTLSYTYDGSATAPTNAGSYEVVGTVSSANYSGSATATMIIAKATPTIDWTAPAAIITGTSLSATQLNATASVAGSFVYSPASGTAMNTAGTQALSANFTPTDRVNYNSATASVNLTVNTKQTPVITWATPAAITYGTALSATQLNATVEGGVAGSFTYTPASGTLNAGLQTLSVTFTPTNTTLYNTATASVKLTVNKASATVTLGGLSQTYNGSAKSATATTNPAGLTLSYTYDGSASAPTAAGSYTVIGTITSANYTGSATGTMTIAKAAPSITWTAPAAVNLGTALSAAQLNATGSVPGSFVYTPASGTVLNTAGAQTLSASFTPTDTTNYTNASASVSITVNATVTTTPTLTWGTPAAITYGTALSATQLNATVAGGISGSFAYTPASGTVLAAGIQTLSVTFTPTNLTAYNTATATVKLTVNPAAAKAPVLQYIANSTLTAPSAFSYTVTGSDPQGQTLSYSLSYSLSSSPAAAGLAINSTSGAISWPVTVAGSYTIAVTATNTSGLKASRSFTLTVKSAGKLAPVITSSPVTTATTGELYSYPVIAIDPNGDSLSYSLTKAPRGMTISSRGVISWKPNRTSDNNAVSIRVRDRSGLSATQSFTIKVSRGSWSGSSIPSSGLPQTLESYLETLPAAQAEGLRPKLFRWLDARP